MYETYSYDGPVLEFEKVISQRWQAQTQAPSERKARSNLSYQFKKMFGRSPNAKITLPGKLVRVSRKEHAS